MADDLAVALGDEEQRIVGTANAPDVCSLLRLGKWDTLFAEGEVRRLTADALEVREQRGCIGRLGLANLDIVSTPRGLRWPRHRESSTAFEELHCTLVLLR